MVTRWIKVRADCNHTLDLIKGTRTLTISWISSFSCRNLEVLSCFADNPISLRTFKFLCSNKILAQVIISVSLKEMVKSFTLSLKYPLVKNFQQVEGDGQTLILITWNRFFKNLHILSTLPGLTATKLFVLIILDDIWKLGFIFAPGSAINIGSHTDY